VEEVVGEQGYLTLCLPSCSHLNTAWTLCQVHNKHLASGHTFCLAFMVASSSSVITSVGPFSPLLKKAFLGSSFFNSSKPSAISSSSFPLNTMKPKGQLEKLEKLVVRLIQSSSCIYEHL